MEVFDVPKRKQGTLNQGQEYECKMCALIALKGAFSANLKNFSLYQNVDHPLVGKFDDIILTLEKPNTTTDGATTATYCLQLKHYAPSTRNEPITYSNFQQEYLKIRKNKHKNQLYLDDYFCSIEKSLQTTTTNTDNVHYVLFTNKNRDTKERKFLNYSNEDLKFLMDTSGQCPAFKLKKFSANNGKINKTILDKFIVLSNQTNEEDLEDEIKKNFEKFLQISADKMNDAVCKFIRYVSEWAKGHCGGFRKLDMEETRCKILELLATPFVHHMDTVDRDLDGSLLKKWTGVVKKYKVVIIERYEKEKDFEEFLVLVCKKVQTFVLKIEEQDILDAVFRIRNFGTEKLVLLYSEKCAKTYPEAILNFKDLQPKDQESLLRYSLNFQGRKALLHDFPDEILKKLTLMHVAKMMMGKMTVGPKNYELPTLFIQRTLSNIYVSAEAFKQRTVYIVCARHSKEFWHYVQKTQMDVKTAEVFILVKNEIPLSPGKVTKVPCKFPQDFKILLNLDFSIEEICEAIQAHKKDGIEYKLLDLRNELFYHQINATQSVAVVLTTLVRFEEYVQNYGIILKNYEVFLFRKVKDFLPSTVKFLIATEKEAVKIKNAFGKVSCSFYRLRETTLEFLGSTGGGKVKEEVEFVGEANKFDFLHCYEYNSINLITGSPGMGKSVLTGYLMEICPCHLWTVLVNLNISVEYFAKNAFDQSQMLTHLKYFAGYEDLNEIERTCLDFCYESKRICVYFDGYDEIKPELEDKVCGFVKNLALEGFVLFVTTRTVKIDVLETKLNCSARTIKPFTESDQFAYITQYYKQRLDDCQKKIEDFVTDLLTRTKSCMSAWDMEFAGIPLQTVMISETYFEQCKRFCCEAPLNSAPQQIDVLLLYQYFITLKVQNLKKKDHIYDPVTEKYFNVAMKHSLENHKVCAVKAIFGKSLGSFGEATKDIRDGEDKFGLIDRFLDDSTPVFVHRTFAEYLVALYLSENFRCNIIQGLLKILYANSIYDIIRQILDRILSKNSPLHRAVLNGDQNVFDTLLAKEINTKDDAGRNILHLVMSWGARHRIPNDDLINDFASDPDWLTFLDKLDNIYLMSRKRQGSEKFLAPLLNSQLMNDKDVMFSATPLDYAIKCTALECIDKYLAATQPGTSGLLSLFNYTDEYPNFKHLLFLCSLYNYPSVAKNILANVPANTDASEVKFGQSQLSLLHFAARFRSNNVLSCYIDAGFFVDVIDKRDKCTPLHWAAEEGNASTIELLLSRNADVTKLDGYGYTPLYVASLRRNEEAIQVLEKAEAAVGGLKTKITRLYLATVENNLDEVQKLLSQGDNPNEATNGGRTPLMEAALLGNRDIAAALIDHGADVNARDKNGWTPLMYAAQEGQTQIALMLLQSRADPHHLNSTNQSALSISLQNRHLETMEALLGNGANPNETISGYQQPIMKESFLGRLESLQILIEFGADIHRSAALMFASAGNQKETVKLLLALGADVNAVDADGDTALSIAVEKGYADIVRMLLDFDANPNEVYVDGGRTPLMLACEKGRKDIVEILIEYGANVNAIDDNSSNAYNYATRNGHRDAARLVRKHIFC